MIGSGIFSCRPPWPLRRHLHPGWAFTTWGRLSRPGLRRSLPWCEGGRPYIYTRPASATSPDSGSPGVLVSTWAGNAAIAVAMVSYLRIFVPVLERSTFLACAAAAAAVWL